MSGEIALSGVANLVGANSHEERRVHHRGAGPAAAELVGVWLQRGAAGPIAGEYFPLGGGARREAHGREADHVALAQLSQLALPNRRFHVLGVPNTLKSKAVVFHFTHGTDLATCH
ncbi:MAG: hypothetical protein M3495_14375, partial [Pseudomonadota bacterium]|nr:hypothetical protein [Pseudomonadota bacterium]